MALDAADDDESDVEVAGDVLERSVGSACGVRDVPTVDDPKVSPCSKVTGHGLGDSGREPVGIPIARHIHKIEHGDRRCVAVPSCQGSLNGRGWGRFVSVDGGDKTIASAGDGLDELRRARVVAERLAQLGHGMRHRILGDVRVWP